MTRSLLEELSALCPSIELSQLMKCVLGSNQFPTFCTPLHPKRTCTLVTSMQYVPHSAECTAVELLGTRACNYAHQKTNLFC